MLKGAKMVPKSFRKRVECAEKKERTKLYILTGLPVWLQMAPNCSKWLQMNPYGLKWLKMTPNCLKQLEIAQKIYETLKKC